MVWAGRVVCLYKRVQTFVLIKEIISLNERTVISCRRHGPFQVKWNKAPAEIIFQNENYWPIICHLRLFSFAFHRQQQPNNNDSTSFNVRFVNQEFSIDEAWSLPLRRTFVNTLRCFVEYFYDWIQIDYVCDMKMADESWPLCDVKTLSITKPWCALCMMITHISRVYETLKYL